jgi:hypothetical protein
MIKVLQLGSIGPIVEQWQTFLRGQGFAVDVSGTYDAGTENATRAFQQEHKLDIDGKVGNETFGKAGMLGFELVDHTETEASFPALPAFPPLVGNTARQSMFGPLEFAPAPQPDNPEAIRITNGWDKNNIVKVVIPQLKKVQGGPASGNMFFHKKAADQVRALWQAWEDRGLLDKLASYDGAYNPRFVRGGAAQQNLSNHAFGTAFDINAGLNRLGAEPATESEPGCVYLLVPVAHEFGFYWGGHFSRRDGMHFEVAKLL